MYWLSQGNEVLTVRTPNGMCPVSDGKKHEKWLVLTIVVDRIFSEQSLSLSMVKSLELLDGQYMVH